MNLFVDNQKRSVELPFGCCDLADALANPKKEPHPRGQWKLLNGLQNTERYVARLLLTPASLSYLSIDLIRRSHRVQLVHIRDALCLLLWIDGTDKGRLPRIRKFFRKEGISPLADVMGNINLIGESSSRILIYPLPVVAPDAAELITRALREGFELNQEAQLYVSSNEKTVA